jgi:hypothetical protein
LIDDLSDVVSYEQQRPREQVNLFFETNKKKMDVGQTKIKQEIANLKSQLTILKSRQEICL